MNTTTGDSTWVFESAGGRGDNGNKTDSRFFWLALYVQPALWIGLAIMALIKFSFMWLSIIGELALLTSRLLQNGTDKHASSGCFDSYDYEYCSVFEVR